MFNIPPAYSQALQPGRDNARDTGNFHGRIHPKAVGEITDRLDEIIVLHVSGVDRIGRAKVFDRTRVDDRGRQ